MNKDIDLHESDDLFIVLIIVLFPLLIKVCASSFNMIWMLAALDTNHTLFFHGIGNNHAIDIRHTCSEFSRIRFSFGGSINLHVKYYYQALLLAMAAPWGILVVGFWLSTMANFVKDGSARLRYGGPHIGRYGGFLASCHRQYCYKRCSYCICSV
ncbi:unnamed protein product [Trifolium pratense]|uniref:Uncharacterized protein n=1 Tax=Trifolium pratense TaxID=57577 RepID=A0ACB0JKB0_TRIPR|nr:unnamed protein product [Trifolium pratense]